MQGTHDPTLTPALIIQNPSLEVGEWLNVMVLDSTPLEHPASISNIWNINGLNLDIDFEE